MSADPRNEFVFNIVWTGRVFAFLRYFVASQIAQTGPNTRFRFIANGCPPDEIERLREFQARRSDRVVEVMVVAEQMESHGFALDVVLDERHDGEFFCLIDPDILARGQFLPEFEARLAGTCAGVMSGRGVWRDDDMLPDGHPGVSGEYFYASDGYYFGSPHFAMYRRAPLEATRARWGVGFKSAGSNFSDAGSERLEAIGRKFWIYDTGKLMNIFLQEDGNRLCHFEHPNLMHIGGLSHYLSPPDGGGGAEEDGWLPEESIWPWPVTRLEVARFTATVLRNLTEGRPAPTLPNDVDPAVGPRLEMVRSALIDLVQTYRGYVEGT